MERLQKVMAKAGIASRRKCERLISEGKVVVNGEVIDILGTKVDPKRDVIEIEGKALRLVVKKVYVMLNKPANYLTTSYDPFSRKTIMDLVDIKEPRLFAIGRLDRDSEGLLLLTNDGELSFRLTHPKFEIKKTYLTEVRGHPGDATLSCLREGIFVDDRLTQPAKVEVVERSEESTLLKITITEGRKRQVKKMCEKIGHPVLRLKRLSFGPLELGDLPPGQYRFLYPPEVKALLEATYLR